MRWYFSHPTSDTNTAFDLAVREHFAILHLENPNVGLHQTGYLKLGIEYLFFAMATLPAYDGCIALSLPNERWSTAVSREVKWFQQHRRPVLQLNYETAIDDTWSFTLTLLDKPIELACTVEQTRALVHYYQGREHGGRSYHDFCAGRHDPTWEELGVPYSEQAEYPPLY